MAAISNSLSRFCQRKVVMFPLCNSKENLINAAPASRGDVDIAERMIEEVRGNSRTSLCSFNKGFYSLETAEGWTGCWRRMSCGKEVPVRIEQKAGGRRDLPGGPTAASGELLDGARFLHQSMALSFSMIGKFWPITKTSDATSASNLNFAHRRN